MNDKDEALKLALEALKENRAWLETDAPTEVWEKNNEAITAIKAALLSRSDGEAKDEPVAWMREDGTLHFADKNIFYVGQPFYTTPPQRTWVGLTDKEKHLFSSWLDHKTDDEVFTVIEAKLKEKNT